MNPLPTLMRLLARLDPFIDRERLHGYSILLIAGYVLVLGGWALLATGGADLMGKPLGYDFITFYAAGKLALAGDAAAVFDLERMYDAQMSVISGQGFYLWNYPSTFLFVATPLALLPYGLAYLVFAGGTMALFLAVVHRFEPSRLALLLVVAMPATFFNFAQGQVTFLAAVLLGCGLLLVEKRPVLAGICIGLLAIKPHIAVLVPFAFAAAGYWRAFAAAAVTATLMFAAATLTFGFDYWPDFVANFAIVSKVLDTGLLPWRKMPTIYATVRLLGVPDATALALQFASAAIAVVLTVRVWMRPGPLDLKASFLIVATLFVSPYFFDYDMLLLVVPMLALVRRMRAGTAEPGTKAALVLAGVSPLLAPFIVDLLRIQLMPALLAIVGVLVWRRLRAEREALEPSWSPVPSRATA